ncbi:hypothetical protein [Microcoleus sp. FACHB-SPT15]
MASSPLATPILVGLG